MAAMLACFHMGALLRIDPGSAVGPYIVERRLAQGGMSVLYVAHEPESGQKLVLKVLPEELATSSSRARLQREARALASLDHPGIVRIHGFGDHEGAPWIAMEYVEGTDLKRVLGERGPIPQLVALGWVVQAADALVAAHDAGVIHRDLKPSNLLLGADDHITLVDFGIAKRRQDATAGDVLTSAREMLGTPAYLSPEQLEHGLADERSDVWALGCVLFELVVGAPPFGRGGSATTMAAILRDEPEFPEHVTGALVHVVGACLRKNSFARVGSARELALLLRDAIENPASELAAPPPERSSARTSVRPPALSMRPSERTRTSDRPPSRPSERPSRASDRPSWVGEAAPRATDRVPRDAAALGDRAPPFSSASMLAARRAPAPPAAGRLKGTAIRAGLTWFATNQGQDALQRAYEMASPQLQAMLQLGEPACGVIASGWYDVACVGELIEILERVADPPDREAYEMLMSTAIAKDNVNGIYRSLFKLITTPATLEANSHRVWSTYVDEGTLVARSPSRGTLEFEIRAWAHHHPAVCRTVGFMIQNVLRTVGYNALVIERTQCVSDGDPVCAFEGLYLP
jgi:serine/threonine protein kinase